MVVTGHRESGKVSDRDRQEREIATSILEEHFPDSYHEALLDAVGLVIQSATTLKKRDPMFRHRVLKAYEYRCAV